VTDAIEGVENKGSREDGLASDLDALGKACNGLDDVGRVEHSRSNEICNSKAIEH